jgi:hypothetical protein
MMAASMKAISSLFILHLLILTFGITGYGRHNNNACYGLLRLFLSCSVIELTDHSKYLNMGRICSTYDGHTQLDCESGARIPAHECQSRSVYGPAI